MQKALEEAQGDEEKLFMILLPEKGAEIAAKKGDREFGAGVVQAYIHSNGNVGALGTACL